MSKGGFYTAFKGDSVVWFEHNYHLHYHDNDTDRERYFLKRDRKEFMRHDDTIQIKLDESVYIVKFMFDASQDMKKEYVCRLHKKETVKVNFSG